MRKVYIVSNLTGTLYWGAANHWTSDMDDAREYMTYESAVEDADTLGGLVEEHSRGIRRKSFASL